MLNLILDFFLFITVRSICNGSQFAFFKRYHQHQNKHVRGFSFPFNFYSFPEDLHCFFLVNGQAKMGQFYAEVESSSFYIKKPHQLDSL